MLPPIQKVLFLLFAVLTGVVGLRGFYRLSKRIAAGRPDTDSRFDRLPRRLWYALVTTLTQSRTFRKRPIVTFFHSLIVYGFLFYILVNFVDAIDGFVIHPIAFPGLLGHFYVLFADLLSALVLIGVIALVLRRFLLPSRLDFAFNRRTLLHPDIGKSYIAFDSIVVSAFILFHVGSRAIGSGADLALLGPDRFAPFATLLAHLFSPANAMAWRIFGYWGALGSVLLFLAWFPYSKHIHIFMAPAKYLTERHAGSGVLPALELDSLSEEFNLGAGKLEDLAWPRLLDAYACIQCNRCQDVCPATATGKSLSPSALEINKRMELNALARRWPQFESGQPSPDALLTFALSPEAAWACTTCGACMQVCPVQDEPMLDIIDIRRRQVMIEGSFPSQLQTAFRSMERTQNPWGISHEKRMDWADGLNVPTTAENPQPDVLFWVGCAASYDPQSQKTARAFVELLHHAGVTFAVLGKHESCTGDSARRAGNEYLYRQLADRNVATLNQLNPKLIVATCPHCMNTLGKEYRQLGGNYKVMHHTEFLAELVADGRLVPGVAASTTAYHDPCYLGRHNGVFDAPRNLLNILSNRVVELPRNRENSFCCGAGGGQFWKEEEPGDGRISDNRVREAQKALAGSEQKTLAVACPFCRSMLDSAPANGDDSLAIRDVAELLLEGVRNTLAPTSDAAVLDTLPQQPVIEPASMARSQASAPSQIPSTAAAPVVSLPPPPIEPAPESPRKKWAPKSVAHPLPTSQPQEQSAAPGPDSPPIPDSPTPESPAAQEPASVPEIVTDPPKRKLWQKGRSASGHDLSATPPPPGEGDHEG